VSPLTPMPPEDRDDRALGPIVDEYTLEQAILRALRRRLDGWLDEANRQSGGDARVERPRSWTSDDALTAFKNDQLPRILVIVPGTTGAPVRRGDGRWEATFTVGIGAVVAHQDHAAARRKAAIYGAALRTLALHHVAAEMPQIASISWMGSGNGPIPDLDPDKKRQLAVTDQAFEITVVDIADDTGAAPFEPDPDPNDPNQSDPGDRPAVDTTSLTVERRT
jgi:hypothetical protein